MRLRIIDWNTPWFWLVIFYQQSYGEPWIEAKLWRPNTFKRWWLHAWMREPIPDERGAYAVMTTSEQRQFEDGPVAEKAPEGK